MNKPLFFLIIFAGLTIGLTAGMLIYCWVFDEFSNDKFHSGHKNIYRVLSLRKNGYNVEKIPDVPIPMAKSFREDFAGIEDATFVKYEDNAPLQYGETKIEARPAYTDECFFKVFDGFRFIEGDISGALKDPSSIIISEKTAKILFGSEHAIGKIVESNKYYKLTYKIAGVIRIPSRSHINFGYLSLIQKDNYIYSHFAENWNQSEWTSVYIKLKKEAVIDNNLLEKLSNNLSIHTQKPGKLVFQPLDNIHLYSDYNWWLDNNISDYKYPFIFSGLALIIVLMACLNFAVITTAKTTERFVEIGFRKISGSSRRAFIFQSLIETFIPAIIALLLALFISWRLIPWFASVTGKSFTIIFSWDFILSLILIITGISLISGIYPALYVTSYNPVTIFKGINSRGSKSGFIKILVTTQSAVSMILIVLSILLFRQLSYIRNKDLGIIKKNIIVVPTGLWYDNQDFKTELLRNPDIEGVSASTRAPDDLQFLIPFHWQSSGSEDSILSYIIWVDKNFADTYGLTVIKGKFLDESFDYWKQAAAKRDTSENRIVSMPVVINESFAKAMGMEDPIGVRINNDMEVAGVVRDFNFRPLQTKIGPLIMIHSPEQIMTMSIRINPNHVPETIRYIEKVYHQFRADRGFSYSFFEDDLNNHYRSEVNLGKMMLGFCLLAVSISLMGILGMAVYSTERRVKEIGIRKINGAGFREIFYLLNFSFLKWIFLSMAVAFPLSYFLGHQWLDGFAYKTTLSWWVYLVAGLSALFVSFISIFWSCHKASQTNPVEALRYE